MKKIAIFVEGMTEQKLVTWLVNALAASKGLHVVLGKQFGGKTIITATTVAPEGTSFYVLIVDCANDAQVKTQIGIQYPTLIGGNYTAILGLRDVYPMDAADAPKIQANLAKGLPAGPVTPKIYLAIMEVEAWFIAETSHFPRINPHLTVARIEAAGFPIATTNAETLQHPSDTLHSIYKLENLAYKKKPKQVLRTLDAMSFEEFSQVVKAAVPSLDGFFTDLEQALT